jgi:hypothetical protein
MKRSILLIIVLLAFSPAFAQTKSLVPSRLADIAAPVPNLADVPLLPLAKPNTTVHTDATIEQMIGVTKYDRQTNRSVQNRMYYYPDGKIAATWTMGMLDVAYNDRGTGYNFFSGSSWGSPPTARLETFKTGWPSYTPWGANGEMIIAHRNSYSPMTMMRRPERGTGAWTSVDVPGPAGSSGLDWPRVITNGPDRMTVHMIVVTGPTSLGGQKYQGMDGALVYYRSFDGGDTWDKKGAMFPQITSSEYYGIGGDDYAWGTPHGDTIYFVLGGNWEDTFIMASYDNGDNWNKIPILANSHCLVPPNTVTDRFPCADGSLAVEMDKNGVFHVVFGRMYARGESDGQKYFPYTDGLVYWNSTMPMLNDSLFFDTLYNNKQLIGWVYSNAAGDTVVKTPNYGVGLTSHPQITIDESDNIYVLWSGLAVGDPSPDYNFRHLYLRTSMNHGQTWSDSLDLNSSFIYLFREFVYPCMAKNTSDDAIHFIYQTADIPGSAVADEEIPVHDNTFEYRSVLKEDVLPLWTRPPARKQESAVSQNFPNPFTGTTTINFRVGATSDMVINISDMTGRTVRTIRPGVYSPGMYQVTLNSEGLRPGVYSYTFRMGDASYSRSMVVR